MSLSHTLETAELIVVGSGFFGLTVAERAASDLGCRVVILESRPHVGGNAYSYRDSDTDIEVHKYGSHLFHTSNKAVWEYVNRFTEFNDYIHHVWTIHDGRVFSMPVNLLTLSQFFGQALDPTAARELLESLAVPGDIESDFASAARARLGQELYEALFRGYTLKQWQMAPEHLPAGTFGRLPVRLTFDTNYFSDTWQGLPLRGYGYWFNQMIVNSKIHVETLTDFFDVRHLIPPGTPIVYTGPIDRYFDYSHGRLNWRTLDFDLEIKNVKDFQGTSVMNFADESVPYTRIHEFRHLHPERKYSETATVIAREFSRAAAERDEPYYPVNSPSDRKLLEIYRDAASQESSVIMGGRLGSYKYLDMHMAIASALQRYEVQVKPLIALRRG